MHHLTPLVVLVLLGSCGSEDPATDASADDGTADVASDADAASPCGECPTGKRCCASRFEGDSPRCVDTSLNPEHCGECLNRCDGACSGSACIPSPTCTGGACPDALVCSTEPGSGAEGRCCPEGTTFVANPSSFMGCCPDGDLCGCQEGNCPISRRQWKTDVRYLEQADVERLARELEAVRLATYRYRTDASGHTQLGFIIDDGVPAFGIAADQQHVDLYGYTSLAVAALQAQARELDALRSEVKALRERLDALSR